MLSSLRRALGLIKVVETGDQIQISGLPGEMVQRDIVELWGTNRIAQNMFSHIGGSEVRFNKWFAPDVIYAFQRLIHDNRKRSNVRAMRKVIEQLLEHTWLKATVTMQPNILDFSQLNKFHYKPLEHQENFFQTYNWAVPRYRLGGYLLAAGPGTGKTYMGLCLAEMLHAGIVIIVCPKNAVHRVWYNSINGQGEASKDRLFVKGQPAWTSLDGTPPKKGIRHYIVHYDAMERFLAELHNLSISRPVILLDESHNVNTEGNLRADLFLQMVTKTHCQHVLWESGTPVKALGGEVAVLFRSIDPMFDADAQERFRAIYGKASAKANDILAARLGRMAFKVESKNVVKAQGFSHIRSIKIPNGERYTLAAVRDEMRAFVEERAHHYLTNMRHYEKQYEAILKFHYRTLATREQRKAFDYYEDCVKKIRKNYDPVALKAEALYANNYEKNQIMPSLSKQDKETFKHVKSIVKYYQLKVQGEALGQILGRKRAKCIVEMVPYVDWETYIDTASKKTIVFTNYVSVVDAVAAHLKGLGYNPALVYGDTNSNLAAIVGQFARDPDLNPLIATYASLSTAVPLVMANEMVMMDSPFRSYLRDQATARCVRQGQDTDVNIEDIFLDTGEELNISTRSRDILAWSRQQVEEILNFKNPAFALESIGKPAAPQLSEQDWFVAMEEFVDTEDGFQGIEQWSKMPSWRQW